MRLLLNYHDAVLYESDLRILQSSTAWLNDACIHFGMTRLQQQFSPPMTAATYHDDANNDDTPSASTHSHHDDDADKDNTPSSSLSLPFLFYFVDPAVVSFVMHQCIDDEEILDFVVNGDPLLWKAKYMFLPINDGHAPSASWCHTQQRGTHWSLLVIVNVQRQQDNNRRTNDNNKVDDNDDDVSTSWSFLHFDSIQGSRNAQTAQVVAEKFHRILLSSSLSSQDDDTTASSSRSSSSVTTHHHSMTAAVPKVIECDTPQQLNGYDCGLHVLASVEVLAARASASVASAATCNPSSTSTTSTTVGVTNEMTSLQPFPHDHMTRLRSTLAKEAIRLAREHTAASSSSSLS